MKRIILVSTVLALVCLFGFYHNFSKAATVSQEGQPPNWVFELRGAASEYWEACGYVGTMTFNADGTITGSCTQSGEEELYQVTGTYNSEPGGSLLIYLSLPEGGSTLRFVPARGGQEGFLVQLFPAGQVMTGSAKLQ